MDHSWGPRPERGKPNMSWLHAHFGQELVIHAILSFDALKNDKLLSLAHGYVLEAASSTDCGLAKGVWAVAPIVILSRPSSSITDARGKTFELSSEGLTTFPWQCWPNMVSFNVLAKWRCGEQIGFGEIQDFYELPQLNKLENVATRHSA